MRHRKRQSKGNNRSNLTVLNISIILENFERTAKRWADFCGLLSPQKSAHPRECR